MKFKPIPEDGYGPWDCPTGFFWVGHSNCETPGEDEKLLIQQRDKLEFISGVSDPDPCYDYHELAIVRLGRKFYLCYTSGCSCPCPTETWYVVEKGTKTQLLAYVIGSDSYMFPKWAKSWAKELRGKK